jgi:hypothetical protein
MSAALGVYTNGSGCSAYSADDGDNGHIGEWAFDDGLPGGEGDFHDASDDDEGAAGDAPSIVTCVRWARGVYDVRPVGTDAELAVDAIGAPPVSGDALDDPAWPLVMRLRGCAQRPELDDSDVMVDARADTFFVQPVLSAAQCAEVVAEMDAIAARVGWHDDGTGVKFQTNLPGSNVDSELFSPNVRAHVASAIVGRALPLARTLFGGGEALKVRGNSAALIRYGHAALQPDTRDTSTAGAGASPTTGAAADRPPEEEEEDGSIIEGVGQKELVTKAAVDAEWRLVEAQPPRLGAENTSIAHRFILKLIILRRQARKVERKSALSAEVHRDGATGVTINVLLSQPTAFTSGGATL